MRKSLIGVLAILLLILIAIGIYFIPPIHDRLAPHMDDLQRANQILFQVRPIRRCSSHNNRNRMQSALLSMRRCRRTPPRKLQHRLQFKSAAVQPRRRRSLQRLCLSSVNLPGVVYMDQSGGWNLCGPTNLYMALKFWKWTGSRDDIIKVVKPGINDPKLTFIQRGETDKNVMPYELVDFVQNDTDLQLPVSLWGRHELIKVIDRIRFPGAG